MIYERMIAIAACDPNGVIGKEGKLPWHCPEELQHFADTIRDCPLIMGYRTFLTLPAHYFKHRKTIIFTHRKLPSHCTVSSLAELFALDGVYQNVFVIGGAQIYTLFLKTNLIDELLLTKMKQTYDGDTFFPLSLIEGWEDQIIRENPLFTIHRYENKSL